MLEEEHPHTNILRIANACFAAGVGGANIITTRSFEPDPEKENEFTRRIARNTQIILANERNIAVSYTHLDVYKSQISIWRVRQR